MDRTVMWYNSCMRIDLPDNVKRIIDTLQQAGHEAYAVGGCVRDSLLQRDPEDWDITTSAKPSQVKKLFRRTVDTGIEHGTVTVMFGREGYEVTTYRLDGVYEDGRHPKNVTFTTSLEEDLKRRDFTINAMAYNDGTGIVDLFHGMDDMAGKTIRAVGDPKERFSEDALRMLRALRFSAQLDYVIEPETERAITELRNNLEKISAERIRTEIQKLLLSDHPDRIRGMHDLGISSIVLQEYDELDEASGDEIGHSLCRADKAVDVRLSILLLPMKNARGILKRLKYDNETIRRVMILTEHADEETELSKPAIRHSIVAVGNDLMPSLFALKRALRHQPDAYIDTYEKLYREILADNDCISLKDLAVTGTDLMNELNMKQGKELGSALQYLFSLVLDDPSLNEHAKLIELLKTQES